jgi:CubicO group peptidase (beta-lactamase class C family)
MKVLTFMLFLFLCGLAFVAFENPKNALQQEIDRIQNGLLPAIAVKGSPIPKMTLSDRMFAYHVTGLSIAVIHDGAIRWSHGFGTLKVGGASVTADTLFQAASVSKPVSAFAVLRLVQSGKLNLDEDVNLYLKSWKVPTNPFTEQRGVTLRELLTHTAGTTVSGFPGYAEGAAIPKLPQILDGLPPANNQPIRVDIVPGTQFRYSGGGYVIVQQILTDVTGERFAKFMQQTVLDPLGMTHSTFERPIPIALQKNAATGYRTNGEPVEGGAHAYPEMAAAGLWTTAGDLARFAIGVQNALAGRTGAILSRQLAQEMVAPLLGKRGVMFGVGGSRTNPYFAHSGGNEGFETYLVAYEKGDGVAVMTNGEGDPGFDLTLEIVRSIAHEYGWPDFQPVQYTISKVQPIRLKEYGGCYKLPSGDLVMISIREDHIFAQVSDGDSWEMFPNSETHFFSKIADAEITFNVDGLGRVTGIVLRKYGEGREAKRFFNNGKQQELGHGTLPSK